MGLLDDPNQPDPPDQPDPQAPPDPNAVPGLLANFAPGAGMNFGAKVPSLAGPGDLTLPPLTPAPSQAPDYSSGPGIGGPETWETKNHNYAGMRGRGPERGPNAGGFQSFPSAEAGVGAIRDQLDRYFNGKAMGTPLTTLNNIIETWAPLKQNPQQPQMIDRASKILGVNPDSAIDWSNPLKKAQLTEAMIRNENDGMLHPRAANAIPKVFGTPNWQPYGWQARQ